jgi:hypothetical protein
MRPSGRAADALRDVTIIPGFSHHAEGSVLISAGDTRVLCNATVENRVPGFLRGKGEGWVTAEYSMLPRATKERTQREANAVGVITQSAETAIATADKPPLPPSYAEVVSVSIDIMTEFVRKARDATDPPHLTLEADLSRMSLLDMHRAGEAIDEGRAMVTRHAADIRALCPADSA